MNILPKNDSTARAFLDATRTYAERVLANDAAKKGIAAAGAGLLVAVITEALWPSDR